MLTEPAATAGDWFCFPQSVVRMDRSAPPTKEHRWIVAANQPNNLEYPCVLRSTKHYGQYSGICHLRHGDNCGEAACRIDRDGWIRRDELRFIPQKDFTADKKSCKEPNELIIEQVMQLGDDIHRRKIEGLSRRRRRR